MPGPPKALLCTYPHTYTQMRKLSLLKKIAFLCGKHCYYYSDFKWEKEGWGHFLTIPKLLS